MATALLAISPSGTWQQLDDEVIERVTEAFAQLLARLAEEGFRFRGPIVEDWGLLASGAPWEILLGSLDDESGWKLTLQRSGHKPVEDNEETRQLLSLIDGHLRALPAFGAVGWVKG